MPESCESLARKTDLNLCCYWRTISPSHCFYYYATRSVIWPILHLCVFFFFMESPPPPLLPPLFVSTNAASRFPQCSANITTKMVDAMEEYEKEAGCVPILHPEVKPFVLLFVRTPANIPKMC